MSLDQQAYDAADDERIMREALETGQTNSLPQIKETGDDSEFAGSSDNNDPRNMFNAILIAQEDENT